MKRSPFDLGLGGWLKTGKDMSMQDHDEAQKRAERYRQNPIYGTDLNRPMSEIINDLRNRMTVLRGQIGDFQFGFPGWRERTQPVEGLLTCGIVTLYSVLQELEKFEADAREFTPAELVRMNEAGRVKLGICVA